MDYTQIKNYATQYYLRYFPSKKRLTEKLEEKYKKPFPQIIRELEELWIVDEKKAIEGRVRHYLFRNKNYFYIKNTLLQKGYDTEYTKQYLDELAWGESLLDAFFVRNKVIKFIQKGKSQQYIISKIVERKEDKILVENIVDELYNQNVIDQEVQKMMKKFPWKKQKIIQKLLSKWFRYHEIKKSIEKFWNQ